MKKIKKLIGILIGLVIIVTGVWFIKDTLNTVRDFPEISNKYSLRRQKILTIAKKEYEQPHQPTYYSQGIKEAWCANFVSWVYMKAGREFSNPNSGSWRIPGTMTLLDYFRDIGKWHKYNSNIKHMPGDVVIYDNGSFFGQHTNIVAAVNGDEIITIDGNSRNKIRLNKYNWSEKKANILGYARLD